MEIGRIPVPPPVMRATMPLTEKSWDTGSGLAAAAAFGAVVAAGAAGAGGGVVVDIVK